MILFFFSSNLYTKMEQKQKRLGCIMHTYVLHYCGYCGLYCRAVCITRNFSELQNPRFIIESGFKSRADYNSTRTVGN